MPGPPGASTRSTGGSAAWPTATSSSGSSTSCCSTSRGGSTARTATATTSSRAGSSGSTTSASSIAAPRCRSPGHLGQADGTAWMGMYSLNMLVIALELAEQNPAYEDIATKFFEHFLYIAGALNGDRRRERAAVGRRGRLLLRHAPPRGRAVHPAQGPLAGRADPAAGGRDARARPARTDARLPPPAALVPGQSPGAVAASSRRGRTRGWASDGCWRSSTVIG